MKRLKHDHVLQIFGANLNTNQLFLVCALKSQGDVCMFLHNNSIANRRKLVRLVIVCAITFDIWYSVLWRELGPIISSRKSSYTRGYKTCEYAFFSHSLVLTAKILAEHPHWWKWHSMFVWFRPIENSHTFHPLTDYTLGWWGSAVWNSPVHVAGADGVRYY